MNGFKLIASAGPLDGRRLMAGACALWYLISMRIELACAECGNNHFTLDEARTDLCIVRCRDCGHEIGTLAELKARVAEEVFRRSTPAPLHP